MVYSVEFEEWVDKSDSKLKLSDDTFKHALYPVCEDCRLEIHENQKDLLGQEQQEERQRSVAYRLAIGGFVFLVVYFLCATYFR